MSTIYNNLPSLAYQSNDRHTAGMKSDSLFDSVCLFAIAVVLCSVAICNAQVAIPDDPPQLILSNAESDNTCHQVCASLADLIPGAVFVRRAGRFEFWDAKQAEITPVCRVEPSSTQEMALVLAELTQKWCHFAIKSGGHDRAPGSSNADGGVTIDLVRLNGISLSEDRSSVTVGAGLRWEEVYRVLEKEQLMVLGGRVSDVGVGGLLLGGGISFFSNERGLACDSIISYEVVLPNATVVIVDQQSRPNLYRALRGAGAANFGVVTSFKLETFVPKHSNGIWNGHKLYPWNDVDELLLANYHVATEAMEKDPNIAIMNMFVCHPAHGMCYGVVQALHALHNSTEKWPDSLLTYGKIKGLPRTEHMQVAPVSNTTEMLAGSSPPGMYRTIYGAFTYKPSVELEKLIVEIFREEVNSVHDMVGFLPGVIMHPFSKTMISKMKRKGGNSLRSLWNHEGGGPFIVLNISWQWRDKVDDDRALAAYHRLMDRMEAAAKQLLVWHPYKYINYAESSQDVYSGYGDDVVVELKELQREIDPEGIFSTGGLVNGFFKINEHRESSKIHNVDADNISARDKSEL